jgi:hypothetical protein
MRAGAVVPLMYETWLLRTGDVDLEMCRERGVLCGGTNERHPDVDVFGYHGVMAARLLTDAGIPVHGTHVLLLCDNSFGPYLQRTLTACGATVTVRDRLAAGPVDAVWDAVLVALRPCPWPVLDRVDVEALRVGAPSTVVVQYWGDLDREALQAARVPVWPPVAPPTGRMAILPSAVGPDPLVRLQAAGLKVAELLLRPDGGRTGPFRDLPQPLWGPTGAGR